MFTKKEEYDYFDEFEKISLLTIDAAEFLSRNLKNYQLDSLEEQLAAIHKIERVADEKKYEMMHYLYQDFLPPIERDDIIELSHALDAVLDNIEDVLIRMDMYQIESIQKEMLTFIELVDEAAYKLLEMIRELYNFKKSKRLFSIIAEINTIEEKGDIIYQRAVKNLHFNKSDFSQSYRYSKIYDAFEECCDSFEHVADSAEAIVLKNS
ncbi:MAG: DUF47 family protein [Pisciglobus halotolerans]|nr:DUF47 family protein [Pisciglobus halotolerans]